MNNKEIQNKLRQIVSLAEACLAELGVAKPKDQGRVARAASKKIAIQIGKLNFKLNSRAFFKKYGKGLSGPKRFVLVVAYLAKGNKQSDITSDEVKNCWNKHQKLLGGKLTTGVYGTRAKEDGWLDAAKNGSYHLTDSWETIFG